MSYMIQGPSQRSQQGATVRERERSPLGKLVAWWVERLAGTALQKPMETFLINSLLGRIAAAITVSLIVGAVVDLSITLLHPFGIATTLQVPLTCGVLAALAGGGGGGPGGAVVGFLWGWVVGEVVDATTAETVAHFMPPVVIQAISWLTATLAGWIAGRVASRCFAKLAKVRLFLARVIGVIVVIAALASMAFVMLQFAIWLHPHLPEVLPLAAKVIGIIWRPIVILPVWLVILAWPFSVYEVRHVLFPMDYGPSGYYGYYPSESVVEFHRRHPKLFATWLVFVSGTVLGTIALLLPDYLREAAYILGGLWILGICLAGQWYQWSKLEDAHRPSRWWASRLVLDITDSIQVDEPLAMQSQLLAWWASRLVPGSVDSILVDEPPVVLSQLFDLVMHCGGWLDIQDLHAGQHKTDPSVCRIEVAATDALTLDWIVSQARGLGARVATEAAPRIKALPPLVGRLKQSVVSPWLMQRMPVFHVVYVAVLWSTPTLAMLSAVPMLAMLSGLAALPWFLLWVLFITELDQVSNWFIWLGTLSVGSLYLVAFCVFFTATYVYTGFVGAISIDVIVLVLLVVTATRWAITAKYLRLVFTGVLAATLLGLNLDPSLRHTASAFGLVLTFNNHSGNIKEMAQVSGWLGVAELVVVAFVVSCALIAREFPSQLTSWVTHTFRNLCTKTSDLMGSLTLPEWSEPLVLVQKFLQVDVNNHLSRFGGLHQRVQSPPTSSEAADPPKPRADAEGSSMGNRYQAADQPGHRSPPHQSRLSPGGDRRQRRRARRQPRLLGQATKEKTLEPPTPVPETARGQNERRIERAVTRDMEVSPQLLAAMQALEAILREKEVAIQRQEYELAAELRDREVKQRALIARRESEWYRKHENKEGRQEPGEEDTEPIQDDDDFDLDMEKAQQEMNTFGAGSDAKEREGSLPRRPGKKKKKSSLQQRKQRRRARRSRR